MCPVSGAFSFLEITKFLVQLLKTCRPGFFVTFSRFLVRKNSVRER